MGEKWNRFMGRAEHKLPVIAQEQTRAEVAREVQPPEPGPPAVIPKVKRAFKKKKKR
jgi:hypothetical protein